MLARIRKAKEENEGGFTLIELLVVVVIIGILAAIAIPTFLNQREKAWDRAALSDLRNASVVAEEYYSDKGTYPAEADFADPYAVKFSDGVTWVTALGGTSYCMEVTHAMTGDNYVLKSSDGVARKVGDTLADETVVTGCPA